MKTVPQFSVLSVRLEQPKLKLMAVCDAYIGAGIFGVKDVQHCQADYLFILAWISMCIAV